MINVEGILLHGSDAVNGTLIADSPKMWKEIIKEVHDFFTGSFDSDWEKTTGTLWQERRS